MSWLLDTDVICQAAKKHGDARVVAWLEAEQDDCYTSAIVIAQLACWIRTKDGRQRELVQNWLTRLVDALDGRIYEFNVSVAPVWADQERLLEKHASECQSRTVISPRQLGDMGLRSRPGTNVISDVRV